MPLSFQTEIKPAHVRAATAGIFWRQATQPLAMGVLGTFWIGVHLALQLLFPGIPVSIHVSLALLYWGSLAAVAQVASSHYQAEAENNFQRFEGAPVKVRLEAQGYAYDATWGQGTIPWGQFQSLWCFKAVWVLLQHEQGGASVLLPAEDLDDEARAFLTQQLQTAGAKVSA